MEKKAFHISNKELEVTRMTLILELARKVAGEAQLITMSIEFENLVKEHIDNIRTLLPLIERLLEHEHKQT